MTALSSKQQMQQIAGSCVITSRLLKIHRLQSGVQYMLSMTHKCVMVKEGGKPKKENREFIIVVVSLQLLLTAVTFRK